MVEDKREPSQGGFPGLGREAFERLQPRLVARFRGLGLSLEEARDLAQDVFVQVWKNLKSFEGRSQFDTWVFSIAKRVWLNDLRGRKTQKREAEEVSLEANLVKADRTANSLDLERQLLDQDLIVRVGLAMQELPEEMYKALMMYLNGSKYRQIAASMEIPENRVASLIHQARTILRHRFPPEGI